MGDLSIRAEMEDDIWWTVEKVEGTQKYKCPNNRPNLESLKSKYFKKKKKKNVRKEQSDVAGFLVKGNQSEHGDHRCAWLN